MSLHPILHACCDREGGRNSEHVEFGVTTWYFRVMRGGGVFVIKRQTGFLVMDASCLCIEAFFR